jgi:hypothetical protein
MQLKCNITSVVITHPSASVLPAPRPRPAFWLPCLSLLCFVHCVAMGLLAPWLPAAVAAVSDPEWLEWTLAGVVAISTIWLVLKSRPGPGAIAAVALALALLVAGIIGEAEALQQAGFLASAALQIVLSRRLRRRCQDPSCRAEACGMP